MAAGLIAGAFKGAADAVGGIAEGHIQDERRLSLEQQLSQMEEQRQMRIAEHRENLRVKGRQSDIDQDITNAPRVTEAKVAGMRAEGDAKNDIERKGLIAKAGDPEYLKGAKAVANAERADPRYSPSEVANAEATRLKVADEKRRRELLDQRDQVENSPSMRGDQRAKALARIDKELERITGMAPGKKPPSEYDTVRVKEKQYDDAGNVTREEERTERRNAPPKSERGKATGDQRQTAARHEEARQAIARGADPAKVNQRLKELGYPPL